MSENHVPTWPARTGIGGFFVWAGAVVAIAAAVGFIYTLVTSIL